MKKKSNLKVFLGNAPWRVKGFYGVRAGSRWPHLEPEESCYLPFPFFMAYTAAVLVRDGFEVLMVDGIAENISEDEFIRKIVDFNPDLTILEVSTASMEIDLRVIKKIKTYLSDSTKIAICGPDINIYSKEFLQSNPDIDFVFKGEYEYTARDLCRALSSDTIDIPDVDGLFYRKSNGEVIFTRERELIKNLDELPYPARYFLPMERYNDTPGGIPLPSVQMWASRGCPYRCIFCAWPQIIYGGHSYRTRDPVKVVDEMEYLVKKCGFKSVYFDDDTFNIGKKRILKICEEIKKRNLNVPWAIMARADTADREMLEALKDAGLVALKYGVESGDQKILDNSGKNLKLDKVIEIVKITKELGIKIHLTFTFGLPGENWQTVKKTIDLALELDPDTLQFSIITPFPGSQYYDMLEKKGYLLSKDWSKYNGYVSAVIRTDELSDKDLEKALQMANKAWAKHQLMKKIKSYQFKHLIKKGIKNPVRTIKRLYSIVR